MAEITKVTTPMLPKENIGSKHKPITDQAFELTDPSKIHKADQEGKAAERQQENSANLLRDSMGRAAITPLIKNAGDMAQVFKKIAFLLEMGVSASDVANDESTRELLESLFVSKEEFPKMLMQQDRSSVLFKGDSFNVLREILGKFQDYPKIKDAIANLLKTFDQNVNTQNSVKTILYNCSNLLDYMFSKDRQQFSNYLRGLAEMLLPPKEAEEFEQQRLPGQNPQAPQANAEQTGDAKQATAPQQAPEAKETPGAQNQAQNTNHAAQERTEATNQTQNRNPVTQEQSDGRNQAQGKNTEQTAEGAARQTGQEPSSPQSQSPQNTQNAQNSQNTQNPQNAQNAQNSQNTQQNQNSQNTQYTPNAPDDRNAQSPQNTQDAQQTQHTGNAQQTQTARQAEELPPATPKEMAQVLKNNLLPLLGEIVVKYHQNGHMRDTVMVVIHNIVRVDQGTPETLKEAVSKLINELKQVVNLPPNFEKNLLEAVKLDAQQVKNTPNEIISKLSDIVEKALTSPDANPAIVRQAGNMMVSMLQNQSAMMDILHFMLPLQTPQGQVFTELYVDPETEEHASKRQGGKSRKIFISAESEAHGSFELSFLETDGHVDFAMWCPEDLVASLSGMKRYISDIMQVHGYVMDSCKIEQFREPHSVAEVFPRLLEKKVGVDVRI